MHSEGEREQEQEGGGGDSGKSHDQCDISPMMAFLASSRIYTKKKIAKKN
jgi:hypothetical protein